MNAGYLLLACAVLVAEDVGSASPRRAVEVRSIDGTPTLLIDGRPQNPLAYFAGPHRIGAPRDGGGASPISAGAWQDRNAAALHTIELAARHGIHIHSFGVFMPWSRDGEPADYGDADAAIAAVLARDPEGLLILRFDVDPPAWWRDSHPGELMEWDTEQGRTNTVENPHYRRMGTYVSVASTLWREEAGRNLERFVTHLEAKFGRQIIAYHPCGQNTHEWFYIDSWLPRLVGCEPVFARTWRRWLLERYGSEAAVGRAWGDETLKLADVETPSRAERLAGVLGPFRDPRTQRRVIDFAEYQNEAVAEAIEHFARIAKRASQKPILTFYGYTFEHGTMRHGIQQSGHLALGRLLRCPDIDMICSPISYRDRGPGGIGGYMTAVDSVRLHGKLWFHEDDTRTFRSVAAPGAGQAGGARAGTPDELRAVHARNFAQLLPRRTSCWWMDLGGLGWLDDDRIWRDLERLARLYDAALARKASFRPEIAVIVDETSNCYLSQTPGAIQAGLLSELRGSLYRIGAPCGFYLLSDLKEGRIPAAKLYLFPNAFALDRRARDAIRDRCAGSTRVFFYGNGLIEDTPDVKNMEALLEVPMRMLDEPQSAHLEPAPHPLVAGTGRFGNEAHLQPVFTLDEARPGDAPEILARYRGTGLAAAWIRRGATPTCYLGTLGAPAGLLRNLARDAGVHVYCNTDDVIEADDRFLSIHASSSGVKELLLPHPAVVTDALSGEEQGVGIRSFRVRLQRGETRLYSLR